MPVRGILRKARVKNGRQGDRTTASATPRDAGTGAWRTLLTGLCALAMLLPAAAGGAAQADPRRDLERVQGQLEEARRDLAEIESGKAVTLADLQRSDERRAAIEAELFARETELAAAEEALRQAIERLERTTQQLTATQDRLARTRVRLRETTEDFKARARASYMYGGVGESMTRILEVQDIADFQRALFYMQTVLEGDRSIVEAIERLETQIDQDAQTLARLQRQQAAERATIEQHRNAVAELVEQQRVLKAEAEAEVERHRLILARLEQDEAAHRALIDQLDADSARLEQELRRQAEAAARAARAAAQSGNNSRASSAPPPPASSGRFQRPTDGRQTSPFGYRVHPIFGTRRLHTGLDFGAPTGTPIYAAESGVVLSAGARGGYGNTTVIDHGGGIATLYAHQSRIGVRAGQRVTRGQVIGAVGSTGYSTGPHLHFEVRVNGSPVNPAPYL